MIGGERGGGASPPEFSILGSTYGWGGGEIFPGGGSVTPLILDLQ